MARAPQDDFSKEETERRFEAALRGAREVGHKPMKDISPKREPGKPSPRPRSGQEVDQNRKSPKGRG
jgi:hypothetical protein